MQLEQLHDEWQNDCHINQTRLQDESSRTFSLHSKYSRYLGKERVLLINLEQQLIQHKYDLTEQYNPEDVLPNFKKIAEDYKSEKAKFKKLSKSEVEMLIETNETTKRLQLKIGLSKEKIRFLESLLRVILDRTFAIKNIIDHNKYQSGM